MSKKKVDPAESVDLSTDELIVLAIMDIQVAVADLCTTGEPEYCYSMIRKSMQELRPLAEQVAARLKVPTVNPIDPPESILKNILEFKEKESKEREE